MNDGARKVVSISVQFEDGKANENFYLPKTS